MACAENRVQLGLNVRFGSNPTSSLGAARPLPPSADIGPGGQSVGQAAPILLSVGQAVRHPPAERTHPRGLTVSLQQLSGALDLGGTLLPQLPVQPVLDVDGEIAPDHGGRQWMSTSQHWGAVPFDVQLAAAVAWFDRDGQLLQRATGGVFFSS